MSDVKNSGLATNLVSYWELEEASGTRVDSHGSNDLTDNNTVGSATGIQGDGANIVRANTEYLSITDAAQTGLDFGTGQDFTLQFWYKPSSVVPFYAILKGDTAGVWYSLGGGLATGQFSFLVDDGSTIRTISGGSHSAGNWYHVVGVREGTTLTLYVNNSVIGTDTNAAVDNDVSNSDPFYIGTFSAGNNTRTPDGVIDEVAVWSRALSAAEVTSLFNSGDGLPYDAGGGGGAADNAIFAFGGM